jgi:hypothetical protein
VKFRVTLEPLLEVSTAGRSVEEIEALARLHYRWSKQLFLKARLMRKDAGEAPSPRRSRRPKSGGTSARAKSQN